MAVTMKTYKTSDGKYFLDEVRSAVQKCCRRSLYSEMVYWALILGRVGNCWSTNLWNRLFIMSVEDISIGYPRACVDVLMLRQEHDIATTISAKELCIIKACEILAKAKKCRACDWAACTTSIYTNSTTFTEAQVELRMIEIFRGLLCKDYATTIDLVVELGVSNTKVSKEWHTNYTKGLNIKYYAGAMHIVWIPLLCVSRNNAPLYNIVLACYEVCHTYMRWKEASPLWWIHCILCICVHVYSSSTLLTTGIYQPLSNIDMPDYAKDKHTLRGTTIHKRGLQHFIDVGSVLLPQEEYLTISAYYKNKAIDMWKASGKL